MNNLQYNGINIANLNNLLTILEDYKNIDGLHNNLIIIKKLLLQVIKQVGTLAKVDKIQSEDKIKIYELINMLSDNKIIIKYNDISTIINNLEKIPNDIFNEEIKNIYGEENEYIIFLIKYNKKFNKIKNMIVNIKDIINKYNETILQCNNNIINLNNELK